MAWFDAYSLKDSDTTQKHNFLVELLNKIFGDRYDDINTGINPRNTGTGRPTLATWLGNIQQFQFAVNDFADMNPIEFLHGWKEGSEIEIHCHWCTGGANATTVKGVKWEVALSYASMDNSVFITPIVASAETSIAIGEVANTAKYTSIYRFTPTGYKIGTQMGFRIKRIASVDNPAPVANPFLMSVGVHYIKDSLGSRLISSK
jgi:hypothetical protein